MGKLIFLVLFLILIFGIYFLTVKQMTINAPDKCYSTLQPSNYFSTENPSPITTNIITGDLKIEHLDNQFLTTNQVADSGSMRSCVSDSSTVIMIHNFTEADIGVGDIVVIKRENKGGLLHRIIEISEDSEGVYYITQGDNNPIQDKPRWRFNMVESKIVGVLY